MGIVENYIEYVQEIIRKYSKSARLINQDQINPADLNNALGSYLEVNLLLIAEYQRAKIEHYQMKNEFDKWYSQKFIETRRRLFEENQTKAKVSLTEIEIDLKYNQAEEYYQWQLKIQEVESKEAFLRRLVEIYKNFDSILTTLSNNMRSELRSLSLENRINTDPDQVRQKRIRKEFPKE